MDRHLLNAYYVSYIAKACLKGEKLVVFPASRLLASISEVNQGLFEAQDRMWAPDGTCMSTYS